jgi:hypothetical protein
MYSLSARQIEVRVDGRRGRVEPRGSPIASWNDRALAVLMLTAPFYRACTSIMGGVTTTNIETEAFVVDAPNAPFKLTPIILDEMREDEYLIEMKYSGICHTVCLTIPEAVIAY